MRYTDFWINVFGGLTSEAIPMIIMIYGCILLVLLVTSTMIHFIAGIGSSDETLMENEKTLWEIIKPSPGDKVPKLVFMYTFMSPLIVVALVFNVISLVLDLLIAMIPQILKAIMVAIPLGSFLGIVVLAHDLDAPGEPKILMIWLAGLWFVGFACTAQAYTVLDQRITTFIDRIMPKPVQTKKHLNFKGDELKAYYHWRKTCGLPEVRQHNRLKAAAVAAYLGAGIALGHDPTLSTVIPALLIPSLTILALSPVMDRYVDKLRQRWVDLGRPGYTLAQSEPAPTVPIPVNAG